MSTKNSTEYHKVSECQHSLSTFICGEMIVGRCDLRNRVSLGVTVILIFTDRVRSTREDYVLTRVCPSIHPSVCPHLGGGYPGQVGRGGVTPARSSWVEGVPLPGGTLPQVPPWQTWPGGYPTSGSNWYAAVGTPLAFTQEDFLVNYGNKTINSGLTKDKHMTTTQTCHTTQPLDSLLAPS